jgi:hypothetical protein
MCCLRREREVYGNIKRSMKIKTYPSKVKKEERDKR